MGTEASRTVVVATSNPGKLAEIRVALAGDGWEFNTAADLGLEAPEVVEDGRTFLANAEIKARAYSAALGLPALADDSGLVVDVLGGDPGVRSARYSGDGATDAENNAKLLSELEGVGSEERAARFMCVVVFVDEDGEETAACGTCEGRIAAAGRGSGGFGYDPLFLPDEAAGRTMAELDMAAKNAISHRGRALRALRDELRR
jgi:XTP/dITP diphosphohydrolase